MITIKIKLTYWIGSQAYFNMLRIGNLKHDSEQIAKFGLFESVSLTLLELVMI